MRGERLRATKTRAGGSSQAIKASPSPRPTPHRVLQLQADIGNGATNRLIKHQSKRSRSFSQHLLQAKGGFRGLSSEIMEESQPREVLRSHDSGKSMPEGVQEKMETAFGTSFSDVRIHEGPEASSLGAIAYTRGTHIHFQPGQYNPTSQTGQKLLGHELTHVVQQRAKRVPVPQAARGVFVNRDSALEAEADRLGAKAARGESARQGINTVAASPSQMSPPIQLMELREKLKEAVPTASEAGSTLGSNLSNILGAANASSGASGGFGLAGNLSDLASVALEAKQVFDLGREGQKGKAAAGAATTGLHLTTTSTDLAKNILSITGSGAASGVGIAAGGLGIAKGAVEAGLGGRAIQKARTSEQAINKIANEISDKIKEIDQKKAEIQEKRGKVNEKNQVIDELNKKQEELNSEIRSRRKEIKKKEETLGAKKVEIEAKQAEIDILSYNELWKDLLSFALKELDKLEKESNDLEKEITFLTDEKSDLKGKRKAAASSTDEAKNELEYLKTQKKNQIQELKSLRGNKGDQKRRDDVLEVALYTADQMKKVKKRAIVNTAASTGEVVGGSLAVAGAAGAGVGAVPGVAVTAASASVKPVAFAARKFKQKGRDKGVRGFDQKKATANKQQQRSNIAKLLLDNWRDLDMQEIFTMLPVNKQEIDKYKSGNMNNTEEIEEILKRRG